MRLRVNLVAGTKARSPVGGGAALGGGFEG